MPVLAPTALHAPTAMSESLAAQLLLAMLSTFQHPKLRLDYTNLQLCSMLQMLSIISERRTLRSYHAKIIGMKEGLRKAYSSVAFPLPSTAMRDGTNFSIAMTA